jgi:hypothetical protein
MNNNYLSKRRKLRSRGTAMASVPTASKNVHSKTATNSGLMLQLYSFSKKEAMSKKELKAVALSSKDEVKVASKEKFSMQKGVITFLHEGLLLLKTVSPEISIASEMIFHYGSSVMLKKLQKCN